MVIKKYGVVTHNEIINNIYENYYTADGQYIVRERIGNAGILDDQHCLISQWRAPSSSVQAPDVWCNFYNFGYCC